MLDLQDSTVSDRWRKDASDIVSMLERMETRETWTLDDVMDLKTAIINLVATFNKEKVAGLTNTPDDIVRILAFINIKRFLCLLRGLEDMHPGITASLLDDCTMKIEKGVGDIRPATVVKSRLVTIFRQDLLERIFSDERTESIVKAIETTTNHYGGIYG